MFGKRGGASGGSGDKGGFSKPLAMPPEANQPVDPKPAQPSSQPAPPSMAPPTAPGQAPVLPAAPGAPVAPTAPATATGAGTVAVSQGAQGSAVSATPKKIKAKAPPVDGPDNGAAPEIRVKSEEYYDVKTQVFSALIDTIDLSQLSKLDNDGAREEIRDIVNDIIAIKSIVMSISEQEELLADICNDVLGYGPLEP